MTATTSAHKRNIGDGTPGRRQQRRPASGTRGRRYAQGIQPQPSWWDEPRMRIALATHDMATVIRLLQQHGMSQRAIAGRIGVGQNDIGAILAGRKVRAYDLLIRFADGLGVPRGYMGLAAVPLPCPRHIARPAVPRQATSRTERDQTTIQPPAPAPAAPMLPARWWNEPAMVSALATHDFATIFTYLGQHGISIDEIGNAIGVPADDLACIASGLSTLDSYRALVRLADWLAIPRGHLGLGGTSPDDSPGPPRPTTWTGRHIRALRRALRLSVKDFARVVDVTERMVSKWEARGDHIAPRERIQERLDLLLYRLDPAGQNVYHRLVTGPTQASRA